MPVVCCLPHFVQNTVNWHERSWDDMEKQPHWDSGTCSDFPWAVASSLPTPCVIENMLSQPQKKLLASPQNVPHQFRDRRPKLIDSAQKGHVCIVQPPSDQPHPVVCTENWILLKKAENSHVWAGPPAPPVRLQNGSKHIGNHMAWAMDVMWTTPLGEHELPTKTIGKRKNNTSHEH